MTIDEMITVLQAAKAGKQIEVSIKGRNNWYLMDANWNFADCDYRIKPGPREWTVKLDPTTNEIYSGGWTNLGFTSIKVREVLE